MTISNNIWWVTPGKLGGMPCPTPTEISELKNNGVDAVISLLEDDTNLEAYEACNIAYFHFPVDDDQHPDPKQIANFVDFIEEQHNKNRSVVMHCKGGNGRTGTMLGAYLVMQGQDPAQTIIDLRRINPKAISKPKQETFLNEIALVKNEYADITS